MTSGRRRRIGMALQLPFAVAMALSVPAAGACIDPTGSGSAVAAAQAMSRDGQGREAIACLTRAAEAGDADAAWELAVLNGMVSGQTLMPLSCPPFTVIPLASFFAERLTHHPIAGSSSDCERTAEMALRALELGSRDARFAAAWSALYGTASGSGLDGFRPADPWSTMEQAATQGSAQAMYEMGLKANFGPGGHDDPLGRTFFDAEEWRFDRASFDWMLKAAASGLPEAMDAIGAAHCPGHVVSAPYVDQDFTTAAEWLEKARAQGYAPADARLRRLLATNRC